MTRALVVALLFASVCFFFQCSAQWKDADFMNQKTPFISYYERLEQEKMVKVKRAGYEDFEFNLVAYYSFDNLTSNIQTPVQGKCPPKDLGDANIDPLTGAVYDATMGVWGTGGVQTPLVKSKIGLGKWKIGSKINQMTASLWFKLTTFNYAAPACFLVKANSSLDSETAWKIYFTPYDPPGKGNNFYGAGACMKLYPEGNCTDMKIRPIDYPVARQFLLNQWYHVALTFNGSSMVLYVDGAVVGSLDGLENVTLYEYNEDIFVGNSPHGDLALLNGILNATYDEVKVYDIALTPEQIQSIASAVQPIVLDGFDIVTPDTTVVKATDVNTFVANVANFSSNVADLAYIWDVVVGCGAVTSISKRDARDYQYSINDVTDEVKFSLTVHYGLTCKQKEFSISSVGIVPSFNFTRFPLPPTLSVQEGATLSLRISVIGFPVPAIQWESLKTDNSSEDIWTRQADGIWEPIPRQTNDEFILPPGDEALDGVVVRATITNNIGTMSTPGVTLEFVPAPVIEPPADESSSDHTGVIVGVIVGVVGGCCCLIILLLIILFIIFRVTRKGGYQRAKIVKPEFEPLIFANYTDSKNIKKNRAKKLAKLKDLLIEKDMALGLSVATSCDRADSDKLCKSLVFAYTHEESKYGLKFVTRMCDLELDVADREQTLFRQNSIASKSFQPYARIVSSDYLWEVLARPIHELNEMSKEEEMENAMNKSQTSLYTMNMEVDPTKMDDASDPEINTLQLWLIAQKIFGGIIRSKGQVPAEIRAILCHIKEGTEEKFPDAVYIALGGFFFLRFVCPSILAPHLYGLLPAPAHPTTQRQLILISKVLTNLANGTMPGNKEEYMKQLNIFIERNQDKLKGFFDSITVNEHHDIPDQDIPDVVKDNALEGLYNHIQVNYKKVSAKLQTFENTEDIQARLDELFEDNDK